MAQRGVNKVILVGNLGNDPEVRYMPNGNAVANLSLATSESWKDQQGQQQERTEWHRLTMYRKLAEIAGEYLKKGSQIYVEGKLQTRKWQDNNGQDKYTTEVIVDQMQMLGSGNNNGGQANQGGNFQGQNNSGGYRQSNSQDGGETGNQHDGGQRGSGGKASSNGGQQSQSMKKPDFDFDDDIPFAPVGLQYRGILNAM